MACGSVWYLWPPDFHSVSNRGQTDGMHLVIDTLANDPLAARFAAAARS
jgi:hypothetical protein